MTTINLTVADMGCASCVEHIEQAFAATQNITLSVNLAQKEVEIQGGIGAKQAQKILKDAGYDSQLAADIKGGV